MRLVSRLHRAFSTVPRRDDWRDFAVALTLFAIASAAIGSFGLLVYGPRAPDEIALLAVRAFFIPALGEELVFRAAFVPGRVEAKPAFAPILISTVLFTLWHVVETTFLPGSAATFLRPDFLALAALLGLVCALLRWRSNSIWTATTLHWLVVMAWQGWFGGPSFGAD